MINQIDKFQISLKRDEYIRTSANYGYNRHVRLKHKFDKLKLLVGGKSVAKHNSLDAIDDNNIDEILLEANQIGLIFSKEILLSAPLEWLDIKRDIDFNINLPASHAMSILKELAYLKTLKNEIISFEKKRGFENSILIKSSCKTVKDSLSAYFKIQEIIDNRYNDPDYYHNFTEDYLIRHVNTIRFERRLQSSAAIKKAFHLEHLNYVTLNDIFASSCDVIGEKVCELFL